MDQKRTLNELAAIYVLEPKLKDIYVEGSTDKAFVDWYLAAHRVQGIGVYSIEVIDVSNDLLKSLNLPVPSNRSAVMALAVELTQKFPSGLRVLCVADRDFQDFVPLRIESKYLQLTDCNSLELYAFTPQVMRKFITIALGGLPVSAENLIRMLSLVLQKVFACRLTNELLGWGMTMVQFDDYVEVKPYELVFDYNGFIRAYLQGNNRWSDRTKFETKMINIEANLPQEIGRRLRGHDLCQLLLRVVRRWQKDRKFGNFETLEGCLLAAVECHDLDHTPLFQRILSLTHEVYGE